MLTREELIEKIQIAEDLKDMIPVCELNRRIYQDVLDNYEQGEKYIQKQISYLKSIAGTNRKCKSLYQYL